MTKPRGKKQTGGRPKSAGRSKAAPQSYLLNIQSLVSQLVQKKEEVKEERTVFKPNTKGLKRRTSCVSEPESASEDVEMAPAA